VKKPSGEDAFSAGKFLTVRLAGVAGLSLQDARRGTLADVQPREGGGFSGQGERSRLLISSMLPEAGRGTRNVDLQALRSIAKAPTRQVVGTSRPADLHYDRAIPHPDLETAKQCGPGQDVEATVSRSALMRCPRSPAGSSSNAG